MAFPALLPVEQESLGIAVSPKQAVVLKHDKPCPGIARFLGIDQKCNQVVPWSLHTFSENFMKSVQPFSRNLANKEIKKSIENNTPSPMYWGRGNKPLTNAFWAKRLKAYISQCKFLYELRSRRVCIMCVWLQLLDRNPATRLGMPNSPHGEIRDHQFFRSIDWQKLEARKLDPPFKPKLVGSRHCTPL